MADEASEVSSAVGGADAVRGAVIVGLVPGEPPRVVKEAARYAKARRYFAVTHM